MTTEQLINHIEDIFSMTLYLVIALNNFVIFLSRRFDKHERYNLYFSLFSFACFLFTFINSYFYNFFFRTIHPFFDHLHPPLEMFFTLVCIYFLSRFMFSFFKMPARYWRLFRYNVLCFLVAFILTTTSLFHGDQWYFSHIFAYTMAFAGLGIVLLSGNIIFFIVKYKLYKKRLPGIIAFIVLSIVLYTFIEKILLMTLNVAMLVGSSFVISALELVLANFLALNFNKEYRESIDLKNNLEIKVQQRTAELADANVKLKKLDELKNDFIANVTHDFRAPLTIILNTADLALKPEKPNHQRNIGETLSTIHKASLKLKNNIDKLLEIARMDARGVRLKIEKFKPVTYLNTLLDYYISVVKPGGITIVKELPEQELEDYCTDIEKLEEVLDNVLANAIKFVDPYTGVIRVKLEETADYLQIRVTDNGIGIPKDQLISIFNRFEQVHEDPGGSYHGTGIGLACAKQLMTYLKGSIQAESEGKGRGACFIIQLPKGQVFPHETVYSYEERNPVVTKKDINILLTAALDEKLGQTDIQTIFTDLNKEHEFDYRKALILIIDDDKNIRDIIVEYLLNYGFKNFILTSNGKQGLEAVYKYAPDLIISDLSMPQLKGDQLHDHLLANPQFKEIPFIFLSAIADEGLILERRAKGAEAYLKKPIEEKLFIITVEENLKKYYEFRKAMQLATIDELTGLHNRRSIIASLKHELAVRQYRDLSLIFLDLDNFKEINDTYGHQTGDRVLTKISSLIKTSIRNYDIAGRYGGDEFIIILLDTNAQQATYVAENLRKKICELQNTADEKNLTITASFGLASLKDNAGYLEKMLNIPSLESIYRITDRSNTEWEKIESIKLQLAELLIKMADITLYRAKYTVCKKCGFTSEKNQFFVKNSCPNCNTRDLIPGRNKVLLFE